MRKLFLTVAISVIAGAAFSIGLANLQAQELPPKAAVLTIQNNDSLGFIKELSTKVQNQCRDEPAFQSCTAGCNQQFNIAMTYCNAIPT